MLVFDISKWWRAITSNSPCFLVQMLKALSPFFFCTLKKQAITE